MRSIEERLAAVERAIRLQDRERAVQRALFTTALTDIHDRFDSVESRIGNLESRLDAVQADVSAILHLLNRKFPPGS